jgi:hypothetical protein
MQWEIPLSRNCRRYLDVRCFLRTQSIAQRIEDLPLAEVAGSGSIVGREILGARREGSDLKILLIQDRAPGAVEPPCRRWIIPSPMTFTARVRNDHCSAVRYLVLSRLA